MPTRANSRRISRFCPSRERDGDEREVAAAPVLQALQHAHVLYARALRAALGRTGVGQEQAFRELRERGVAERALHGDAVFLG